MALKVFISGKLYDKDDAKISVYDHGLLYGDGVFEGLRSYNGRVFRLEEHLDRLWKSARAIWLEIPLTRAAMADAVNDTLNWTAGTITGVDSSSSRLEIASGATAVISAGGLTLGSVTFSNFGTTQINLPASSSLNVPVSAVLENQSTGLFEFVADQNSVTGTGLFNNLGG